MSTVIERPIHKLWLRADIPFADYLRLQGVSWSKLSAARTSMLAYHEGLTADKQPTPLMIVGSAIHAAVLEPHIFDAEYVLYEGRKSGGPWETFKAEHPGATVLNPEQYEQVMGAAWAVLHGRQGREARSVMRRCKREVTLRWVDPATHIRCKARPDLVRRGLLADLKTTGSAEKRKFGRLAGELGYHGKMAFAAMGLRTLGVPFERVAVIAVEQKPPHDIGVFDIGEEDLALSEDMVSNLLAKVKECRRRRIWPGRYEGAQALDLVPWLFEDETDYSDTIEVLES